MPDKFDYDVDRLRSRLCNKKDEEYLFPQLCTSDCAKEDLPDWIEQIWQSCISDEDLNIPSQRELLSEKRCNAVSNELNKTYSNNIKSYKALCTRQFIENFKQKSTAIIYPILDEYEKKTKRYVDYIRNDVKDKLLQYMKVEMNICITSQII